MTYIIRPPRTRGLTQGRTVEELTVSFERTLRRTGKSLRGEGIRFLMAEDAGPDEQTLRIRFGQTVRLDGTSGAATQISVSRSQEAVDKTIRVLREEDEKHLAAWDEEIDAAKRQLRELRDRRAEAAVSAWKRALKVPLRDLVARIGTQQ